MTHINPGTDTTINPVIINDTHRSIIVKEHNYCYKHDDNLCKDCKDGGGQCGYYCHRCPCPKCLDNFGGDFT